jgi:glutathione S-transferase
MKLINATPSPYGRKVAIALKEKSIPYEVQYDIPWIASTIVPEYSPLQQLPILITDDGKNVYDSSYILDWLEIHYPTPPLLSAEPEARAHALLLRLLGERLAEIAQIIVFEVARPDPSAPWLERQTRKIGTGLAELAKQVADRAPSPADPITLGDIAAGSTLRMLDFIIERGYAPTVPEFSWRPLYPNLVAYAAALESRPSFQETQPVLFELDLKDVVEDKVAV